jgi:hypothetical protein
MCILAGRLRYQRSVLHRFRQAFMQAFRKAAEVARTWLPGWLLERPQLREQQRAVAAALQSLQSLPLLRRVPLALEVLQQQMVQQAVPQRVPPPQMQQAPQVLQPPQGWRVWAHPGVWLLGQALP